MIPDNSRKKLEELRQEMARKAQLSQQYDKEMAARYTRDMPSFTEWSAKQPKGKAEGGKVEPTQDEMRLALTKARRNGMYSPLERLAIDIPRNKGTGAEFMAEISKQKGFKPEEVADRKIPIPEGKMTKLEFLKHLRQHSLPPLKEQILQDLGNEHEARDERAYDYYGVGYDETSPEQRIDVKNWVRQNAARFQEYQLPDGENYREMLLRLPTFPDEKLQSLGYLSAEKRRTDPVEWANSPDSKRYEALLEESKKFPDEFHTNHFIHQPNTLAHVRLSDREGPNGEKLLHVEELQSDWHQQGRKRGYVSDIAPDALKRNENGEFIYTKPDGSQINFGTNINEAEVREGLGLKNSVPDAPFKKSWHELGMKHVLHHAAKHGYEGVVITPGDEQAKRWRDEGLKVHYDKKIPEFLNKFGKPFGVQMQPHAYRISGEPEDYGNASERLGLAHIPMNELTLDQNRAIANEADKKLHYFPINDQMRTSILKEGLPQYMRGGVVHKAEGGAVLPLERIKAQMLSKGLSSLQSIGAEEAPSLGIKAYVPTVGRPDNGQMPVGGVDTSRGDLPVGGIDMSRMQAGQQLMPNAPPSPAGMQQGMNQVPQGDKIPTMDGTGMPPNPNANPNQMGSNILSMTPQGQAMAAMRPQGLAKGGKVEVRPTVFDDKATRKTPEIETAVKALQAGIINQKEYDRIVQKYKPVKPYDFVPAPATDEDAMRALNKTQQAKWRGHEDWPAGHPVGLRLDIPSYERHGVWVNSIHDESNDEQKRPTSYGPVSAVRNATFEGTPHKAVRVATGEQSKSPFAKIMGELEHIDEKAAVAHMKKFLNHPEYRQIGYDPRRHGDFYDRETMKPVQSAEHVVQIGPLVLAKNPVYGKKRTQYAAGGAVNMARGGMPFAIQSPKELPKAPEEFTPYDTTKPSIPSLSKAFDEAIAHHLSLSPEDRMINSQRAAMQVAHHIGMTSSGKPKDLLGQNEKLLKSGKGIEGQEPVKLPDGRGVETTGLALAPAYEEGNFNTCPNHHSCKAECLGKTSGNYFKLGGGQDLSEFKGPRLNSLLKTNAFLRDPHALAVKLYDEIDSAKQMAAANGNHLGVRLNVLSDINPRVHKAIIEAHPDVTFYDYTKNNTNPIAPNHHYTYSSTGVSQPGVTNEHTNWKQMRRRLDQGDNVAMAFSHKDHLPTEVHDQETGKRYKVIDGDTHDFRPLDLVGEGEDGVIVGLKNKKATGKMDEAHIDSKGFFLHYDPQLKMTTNAKGQPVYARTASNRISEKTGKPMLGETIPQNRTVNIQPQARGMIPLTNDGEKQ